MMDITFEFATQDNCLDYIVPSDLRKLVGDRDRALARIAELEAENKISLKALRALRKSDAWRMTDYDGIGFSEQTEKAWDLCERALKQARKGGE